MALSVAVGSFTILSTDSGTKTYVSGLSFQPKLVHLLSGASGTSSGRGNHGWASGTAAGSQFYTSIGAQDAGATMDTARCIQGGKIIGEVDLDAGGVGYEASLSALNSDGFDLNVTTSPGSNQTIYYLCVAGSGFSADVGTDTITTTAGNQNISTSVDPDVVYVSSVSGGNTTQGPQTTAFLMHGFGISSTERFAHGARSNDGVSTSAADRYLDDNGIMRSFSTSGFSNPHIDLDSLGTSQFTIAKDGAPSSNFLIGYVALEGVDAEIVNSTQKTASPWAETITTSWQPEVAFYISHGSPVTGSVANTYRGTLGVTDGTTHRVITYVHEDNASTANASSQIDAAKFAYFESPGGGKDAAATAAFNSSDITLTWDSDSDAVARAGRIVVLRATPGGAYTLTADSGSYIVTGTAAGLKTDRKIAANTDAYAITGTAAGLFIGYKITADVGNYTYAGQDVTLSYSGADKTLTADAGSYTLTGSDATLKQGHALVANAGSYTVSGTDAGLQIGYKIAAGADSYTLTGTAAGLAVGYSLTIESGAYTLTGQDATLTYSGGDYSLVADSGTYTLTGTDTTLQHDKTVSATAGSYTVTGTDAALYYGYRITADAGNYTATGTDASLTATRTITASVGSYDVLGSAAGLSVGKKLSAAAGAIIITGTDATLEYARKLAVDAGAYTLTGSDATLDYSAAVLPVTPTERTFIVGAENRTYIVEQENRTYVVKQ